MSSMIGIKIAVGSFFPLLEEDTVAKKRLVLTTAHDVQTNVQIDVYKSSSMSMNDASYIGTLLVENISQKKKATPRSNLSSLMTLTANFRRPPTISISRTKKIRPC
jgi:molecular chaperone DnaK (HSP70)